MFFRARALRRGQQPFDRSKRVGFARRLVPANAVDAREAQGEPGFVARRTMHAVAGDFEDELGPKVASVMKRSQRQGSNGAQVGSGRRL
jgi:hypothetical protein